MLRRWCFLLLVSWCGMVTVSGREIDFARDVLPVLSNKCFVCHGPDAKKGELRLDSYEAATADLGGYQAIDPDTPADSEIIARIHDLDDPMPPEDAEKSLSESERDIIKKWVEAGGQYSKHWAFVPPRRPGEHDKASIDYFVEQKLDEKGLKLAIEAPAATLARRVALTLTGLPPEPEQLNTYLHDESPQAYERLVDSLLASPRFGEHQARYWLDAVRYGDTHGLHLDNRRGIFPYRDWVVKAFNQNLPFDQFITWQLGGDLLPNPTTDQLIATGYVRMNPTTSEGGAIKEEFQAKNNFDRTENFGTVFLGMTLNCARCHTHKYDPITHREYYELFAFFNSTAEAPLDGNAYVYAPVLEVPSTPGHWNEWSRIKKQRTALLAELDRLDIQPQSIAFAETTLNWQAQNWRVTQRDIPIETESPTDKNWKKIASAEELKKQRFGNQTVAKWVAFELNSSGEHILVVKAKGGQGSHIDNTPGTHQIINTTKSMRLHTAKLVGIDGKIRAAVQLHNPWESLAKHKKWSDVSEEDRLLMAGDPHATFIPEPLRQKAASLSRKMLDSQSRFTTTLIAKDLPEPRETRVLERGEYDMPIGEPLEPDVFAVLNPLPTGATKNRLGLAQWLTSPDQPLAGRVLINRIWQRIFGEGLVRSPEDFGLQGKQPTHPELLDWLTVTFRETGWDHKHLVKQMVLSRTFRQDSSMREKINDPENLLWARGPLYRLDAEVIRDTGLWASGLLVEDLGGEGVKPYQPAGMWKALAHPASNTKEYLPDIAAEKVNRRSLYVYWKRTSPHPMMTLFDAPSRETSCVRRSRGNTPLQSLGLLNEPQRLKMARGLVKNLVNQESADQQRLEQVFRMLACRSPEEKEASVCLKLLRQAKQRYDADIEAARKFCDDPQATAEQAAWVQLTNTILATDIAILLY